MGSEKLKKVDGSSVAIKKTRVEIVDQAEISERSGKGEGEATESLRMISIDQVSKLGLLLVDEATGKVKQLNRKGGMLLKSLGINVTDDGMCVDDEQTFWEIMKMKDPCTVGSHLVKIDTEIDFNAYYTQKLLELEIAKYQEDGVLLVQMMDVTRMVSAEDRVQKILETSFDGYWDWYIEKDYEYMSPRFWDMFGYDYKSKQHRPSEWQDMLFQEDLALALENFRLHAETKGKHPYVQEVRYRHKDGSTVYVSCKGTVVEWGEDGRPLRMVGTHQDITRMKVKELERERLANQLKAKALELLNMIECSNSPIFAVDPEGKIMQWNAYMSSVTGYSQAEVVGKDLCDFIHKDSVALVQEIMDKSLKSGVTSQNNEIAFQYKDGSMGTYIVNVTLQKNPLKQGGSDEEVTGLFFLGQDITNFMEIKSKFIKERERAAAESSLNDFLAHEVRNPLTIALATARFIKTSMSVISIEDETLKQGIENDIGLINSSLLYINELLDNMLNLNRFASGSLTLKCDTYSFTNDVLNPVQIMLKPHSSNVQVKMTSPEPFWVKCDSLRLKQVLVNLVKNSIKFVEEGYVHMSASRDPKKPDILIVAVEDSGPGIPENQRDNLFQKYQESLDVMRQGTGIGLSLCKTIVEAMNGTIELDTAYRSRIPGRPGCRFVLRLPLPEQQPPTGTERTRKGTSLALNGVPYSQQLCTILSPDKQSGTFHVLAVDDDPIIRQVIRRKLAAVFPRIIVEEASNGNVALEMVQKNPNRYEIMFVDQYMPGPAGINLSGTETIQGVRGITNYPIILGCSSNDVKVDHIRAGANGFIRKPFKNINHLLSGIIDAVRIPAKFCGKVCIIDDQEMNCEIMARLLHSVIEEGRCEFLKYKNGSMALQDQDNLRDCDLILLDENYGDDTPTGSELVPRFREAFPNAKLVSISGQDLNASQNDLFDLIWKKPLPTVSIIRQDLVTLLVPPCHNEEKNEQNL